MALEDLNLRLRASIDQMPIAYVLVDKKNRVAEWNPSAKRIFGYSKSEMLGKNLVDYIVPEPERPAIHAVCIRVNILQEFGSGRNSRQNWPVQVGFVV